MPVSIVGGLRKSSSRVDEIEMLCCLPMSPLHVRAKVGVSLRIAKSSRERQMIAPFLVIVGETSVD